MSAPRGGPQDKTNQIKPGPIPIDFKARSNADRIWGATNFHPIVCFPWETWKTAIMQGHEPQKCKFCGTAQCVVFSTNARESESCHINQMRLPCTKKVCVMLVESGGARVPIRELHEQREKFEPYPQCCCHHCMPEQLGCQWMWPIVVVDKASHLWMCFIHVQQWHGPSPTVIIREFEPMKFSRFLVAVPLLRKVGPMRGAPKQD